ncbi:MAG: nucleotide exchange factor GrpE [Clostridia bacterium]|nr:nucleotide exchange factor GrpE [Clostridia bacterium]
MAAEETKDIEKETVETAEETETTKEPEKEKTAEEILQEEVDALKDKMLRHAAEFDNFKKRTAKEREDIFSMAVCDTVMKILPVKDNLERAITADDSEGGFKDGVKMILKQLDDALSDLGVEKIKTVGEKFNPEFHNAVMHEENENFGENTVSEELMSGYLCKGKVVRFAMVKVAN